MSNPNEVSNDRAPVERESSLERRKMILGAVYDLISAHGIEGMTMRQVADATRLSTGTINYHFDNKHALVVAALEQAYELPEEWRATAGSAETRLRRLLRYFAFRNPNDRWWRFFLDYLAHSMRDDEMRGHLEERFERQHRFWLRLIQAGIDSGEFDAKLDAALVTDRLLASAYGLVVMQMLARDRGLGRRVNAMIDLFVADLKPRTGR